MSPVDSPAVARRRVRLALRHAREARGLTQAQVAEAMEWSLSKVMRIESGEVTISPNDLRPLLGYLGVDDRTRADDLVQDARVSRRRQLWWDESRFREHLTPAMRQLIQYEAGAAAVRHFHTMMIPGPLQTPEYAHAVLHSYHNDLPDEDIEVRLDARLRRRQDLLNRKNPPNIYLLLDESVPQRTVGGSVVMGHQLAELVKLVDAGLLLIRIVPLAAAAPMALVGSYDIIDLADEQNAVLYRESLISDEVVEDSAKIAPHRDLFEQLWSLALDESASVRFVAERAEQALASADSTKSPG